MPIANMKSWSGNEIADIANLRDRRIYLQTGSADVTIGPNVMGQLKRQLENFVDPEKDHLCHYNWSGSYVSHGF